MRRTLTHTDSDQQVRLRAEGAEALWLVATALGDATDVLHDLLMELEEGSSAWSDTSTHLTHLQAARESCAWAARQGELLATVRGPEIRGASSFPSFD